MTEHARSFAASSRAANCSKNCSSVSSCAGKLPLLLSWVSMKYFMVMLRSFMLTPCSVYTLLLATCTPRRPNLRCAPLLFGQFCEKGFLCRSDEIVQIGHDDGP